ncbi:hypothetical protein WMF18_02990 [Sorangium sp. So ce315]|uniref:hypothetical protein n=1 Tax=Sorangium sp. So ce315 TaxID=3133299 RepID=UPI003F5D5BD8
MIAAPGAASPAEGALPSPVDFVVEALAEAGALAEREGARAVALLPPPLAAELEVPEECALALYPDRDGDVACGLGSTLLERLIARARGRPVSTSVRLAADPPRPAQVRAAADRFVLRNGLCEPGQISVGTAVYVAASVAYGVEADDRREGLLRVVVNAHDGGEPDAAVCAHLDLAWPSALVRPSAAPRLADGRVADWIALRAERAVRAAVQPLLGEVERRHARDHDRIVSYFADLIAEARAPRRRADPAAVEAKVAHLVAERDAKLEALPGRFAARVTCSVAALVSAEVPAALVTLRLRRRKEARDLVVRLPAGASSLDRLTCEACGAATARPAACDDRMHLLCEACAPNAQGRIACPACARRR